MTTLNDLPQPATHYPFQPGEAVYYLGEKLSCHATKAPPLIPAIVLEGAKTPGLDSRIAILGKDGRVTRLQGKNLIYQGYCAFCGVPAVLDREALVCPRCGEAATAVPPPPELTLRWYPLGRDSHAQAVRECVLTGCGWKGGMDAWRERHWASVWALLGKHGMLSDLQAQRGPWGLHDDEGYAFFEGQMKWYSELGDEESFLAYYQAHGGELPSARADRLIAFLERLTEGDGPGRASQRLVLPPLDIERTADDSTPDGADALTDWLARQFRKAA